MRRCALNRHYDDRQWSEQFLDGLFPLRSLGDYEDMDTRGDRNEGTAVFRSECGLVINNPDAVNDVHGPQAVGQGVE